LLQENEGDGGESQTEGDLSDLAELSVNGPGSVDVKKEIGVKGKNLPYPLICVVDPDTDPKPAFQVNPDTDPDLVLDPGF
jgi:hypothetical protein